MKLLSIYLYILILLNIISILFAQTSPVYPVYKIILTEKIDNIYSSSNQIFNFFINIKGVGIKFDLNSEINIIPMHLMEAIYHFYRDFYANFYYFELSTKNEYKELIISDYSETLEIIHFILEDRGIVIPINELFILDKESKRFTYRFLGKEDEDNIIIGKDLIDAMDIKFEDNNKNYIIGNEEFVIRVKDN